MNKTEATLVLRYTEVGTEVNNKWVVEQGSLDDLKTEFLKRFGNIRVVGRLEDQREKVKEITRNSQTVQDWVSNIRFYTDYKLEVKMRR